MENMYRVISRSTARVSTPADEAGITDAAHIHAIFGKIVFAPAFTRQFAETINRIGVHHAILRGVMLRRMRPENGYRAWPEHLFYLKLHREIQHVQKAGHVQVPGHFGLLFAYS